MFHALVLATFLFAAPDEPAATAPGRVILEASLARRELVVRVDGRTVRRYAIAVGSERHPTPQGAFPIRHIVWNPDWHPPKTKWARGRRPTPPGHPDNPMRVVKIFFKEPDYYIHGTNDPESIGHARSHGCIRMTEKDAFELGRFLMEQTGAARPEEWFDKVFNRSQPAHVWLPKAVKLVID